LISVPRRDLDVDSILVRRDSVLTDEPTAEVQLRLSVGATYTMTSFGVGGDPVPREVALPVRDAHSGTRVADALRHATIICGAAENIF